MEGQAREVAAADAQAWTCRSDQLNWLLLPEVFWHHLEIDQSSSPGIPGCVAMELPCSYKERLCVRQHQVRQACALLESEPHLIMLVSLPSFRT